MRIFSHVIIFIITAYRKLVSPFLAPRCKFYPTCSSYCLESFRRFPLHIAIWYSAKRILSCNPLSKGGEDFLPLK